jgi:hypothetical protein
MRKGGMSRGRLVGGGKGRAPKVEADNDGRGRMARESRLGRGRMASVRRERLEAGTVVSSGAGERLEAGIVAASAEDRRGRRADWAVAAKAGTVDAEGGQIGRWRPKQVP